MKCQSEIALPREISYPLYVYCCDGTTVVLDGGKRGLKILSANYKNVTRSIPLSIGQGPGELSNNFFNNPGAILLFQDTLVVCDKRKRKINFYNFNGVFKGEIQFRKPITTIEKKNGGIVVFFQNNGRFPPITFAQQIDEQSRKVIKTTVVTRRLSFVRTINGAKFWSNNLYCIKQNGDFIMLNDKGTITIIRENGEIIDRQRLPVKNEGKISVEGDTVTLETLGYFNSMKTHQNIIFLTYVQTDSSTHKNTTFLYRIENKKITKVAFKDSVKALAGIINNILILFDKDNESILKLPISKITEK
ncbi:MAG: hypothetical protein GXO69_03435 [Acidobacteria bacterium]|nr:hypothetical protein [Acidobacteriota bacterium]